MISALQLRERNLKIVCGHCFAGHCAGGRGCSDEDCSCECRNLDVEEAVEARAATPCADGPAGGLGDSRVASRSPRASRQPGAQRRGVAPAASSPS